MTLFQKPQPKQLGHEYVSGDEESIISEMIQELKDEVNRVYENKEMLRQIHTKMHGCVRANFSILEDIPEELKVGVFKTARTYSSWIRLSNASSTPKPDKKKDIRGFAIKLMEVEGEKLMTDESFPGAQDFVLMSSPRFFARNIKQFRRLLKASAAGNKLKVFSYLLLNPAHWGVTIRLFQSNIHCKHPFAIPYWSTQPYQLGSESLAVKYMVKPAANQLVYGDMKSDHYLRENMAKTLAVTSADFDFYLQVQTDAVKMPIEDPTVVWNAPFFKVARIHVPVQDFDRPTQNDFGESITFNPWHCLSAHRPLGSFNRARRRIYEELSRLRNNKNRVPIGEPMETTAIVH